MIRTVISCVTLLLTIYFSSTGFGGLIVTIGREPLQPNSRGQLLPIFVRSDSGSIDVVGMDLFAFIGDGKASQTSVPRFDGAQGSAIRLSDGAGGEPFVWERLTSGFLPGGASPEMGNPFRSTTNVVANNPFSEKITLGGEDVLVAQFVIDTTDIAAGTFAFTITTQGGAASQLVLPDLTPVPLSFSGNFSVTPEPSLTAMMLIAVGVAGWIGIRRSTAFRTGLCRRRGNAFHRVP